MKLKILLDDGQTLSATVDKDQFVIGRSQKCDVVIPVEGLSRQHCQVETVNGEVYVTDLASANGVFIDDIKIPANQKTKYFTTSKLSCGTAEITEFIFTDQGSPQEQIQIDPINSTGSTPVGRSSPRPRSTEKKAAKAKAESWLTRLHPGVQGVLVLTILAVGFLVFNNIFSSGEDENELFQMQHDAAMKNRRSDGAVKTQNF